MIAVGVYVQVANRSLSGCPSVMLAVPEGTDRHTLDQAAIAVLVSGPSHNPVSLHRHQQAPSLYGRYDPETWGKVGRSRLLGNIVELDAALALIPAAISRLEDLESNTVIYSPEARANAGALAGFLAENPA